MNAPPPAVAVSSLHKDFRVYESPRDRLAELFTRRPRHLLFRVLSDVSFAVPEGGSLGVIGANGAGKSTLLKVLAGTLRPTAGEVRVRGRVAALLELGAGFHPEFSGRRNIHLNAALLGVPDARIDELEEDIIAFSELSEFIDRPVKTYSSGMFVRLAFSIATMARPDVLVIDEALSVGDMAFQRKCLRRMHELRERRKTMVFCSHSMFHIQELCDTAVWLHRGRIREIGDCRAVVGHYEDFSSRDPGDRPRDLPEPGTADRRPVEPDCRIDSLTVKDLDGVPVDLLEPLGSVVLEMTVEVLRDGVEGHFGFAFMRSAEEPAASFLTIGEEGVEKGPFRRGDRFTVSLTVRRLPMRVGEYHVAGGLADGTGLHWYETRISRPLSVRPNKGVGPLVMDADWSVRRD